MRRKNDMVRYEMVICPKCGSTCVLGNDDDRHQQCAACITSFRADDIFTMTDDEFRILNEKHICYERGGWTAYGPLKSD